MAQSNVKVPILASGIPMDTFVTITAANNRESVVIADPSTDAAAAKVNNTTPGGSDYGLTVRVAGTVTTSGGATAPSLYAPLTQVTKANIKASAGSVISLYISNINAAVRYFQLHNKATAPVATDVPLISLPIGAGTTNNPSAMVLGTDYFTTVGDTFSTGIGWAISTTFGTFTDAATSTDHIVEVHYS